MFRDSAQRARVCSLLTTVVWPWKRPLFGADGPTAEALKLERDRTASSGELLLLDCAFALWREGSPRCPRVDELWSRLDRRCFERVVRVLDLLVLLEYGDIDHEIKALEDQDAKAKGPS